MDITDKFRRCNFKHSLDLVDDLHNKLGDSFRGIKIGYLHGNRQTFKQVSPLYRHFLVSGGVVNIRYLLLDLFRSLFADQKLILLCDIPHYRFIKLVAGNLYRLRLHDTVERHDSNISCTAADIHYHIPVRL